MGKKTLSPKWKSLSLGEQKEITISTLRELSPNNRILSMDAYQRTKPEWMPSAFLIAKQYANGKWSELYKFAGLEQGGKKGSKRGPSRKDIAQDKHEQKQTDKVISNAKRKIIYTNGIACLPPIKKKFYHTQRMGWVTAIVSELR